MSSTGPGQSFRWGGSAGGPASSWSRPTGRPGTAPGNCRAKLVKTFLSPRKSAQLGLNDPFACCLPVVHCKKPIHVFWVALPLGRDFTSHMRIRIQESSRMRGVGEVGSV